MREIVLDTETTGFEPRDGHRIVEIGAIELINHVPTGRDYHRYINPERDMPADAFRVHGLSEDFLKDKPVFADIADEFLAFAQDSPFVIHNAEFDMKFLNAEYEWLNRQPFEAGRAIDTLRIARQKYPGAPASLDALCKRFGVDLSERSLHGALLDSRLLAEVYLELIGGRQPGLTLKDDKTDGEAGAAAVREPRPQRSSPLPSPVTDEEKTAHDAMIEGMAKDDPVWQWPEK